MTKQDQIQLRAIGLYLSGSCTFEQAHEQAKSEILRGGIPKEIRDLFGIK